MRWLGVAVFLGLLVKSSVAAESKPNVLFIAVDDLNDWVSPLGGYQGTKTPNLDRLASRGVTFTRAYCSAPACNPSRASLLTGIQPSTSGVYHNNQPWRRALPETVTLPQHFMAAGYTVRGGGKIYHGAYPDAASWQEYFAQKRDPGPGEPKKARRQQEEHPRPFTWGPLDVDDAEMPDAKTAEWAIEQLSQPAEKPFFLAVGFYKPHLQWYVPQKYFDLYPLSDVKRPIVPENDLDDVPLLGRQMAKPRGDHRLIVEGDYWESAVQAYLAAISFADGQIGRVLEALETSPHARNTIVVLWGDHGWHLGEKEHWRKFALWEEATRVPLFISVPGITTPGARCERTVSLIDLYPTLIELCGLPPRETLAGRSIAPLLAEPSAEWEHPVLTTHGRDNHAVRDERWRYIRYSDGSEELYDHAADPREWKNLAQEPRWAEVKSQLARHLPAVNADDAATVRESGE
ncbi:MAG: sulfatase [Pirellulales bacterium]|nr:sulfatase [Pirellulales bacterium]